MAAPIRLSQQHSCSFDHLVGTSMSWSLVAHAQQAAMPVVGYLHAGIPETSAHLVAVFRKGLSETGYVDGQNAAIEYRWANNDSTRLPELAADLVRRQVAVIAAKDTPSGNCGPGRKHDDTVLYASTSRDIDTVFASLAQSQLIRSWSVPARSSTTVAYNSSRWRRTIGCLRSISGVRLPKPAA
jgi:ABC-type uncharacterized transport system substrate-binding protein